MNKGNKFRNPPSRKSSNYQFKEPALGYDNEKPVFSFLYVVTDKKDKSFSVGDSRISKDDYCLIFDNLRRMSSLTWGKIKQSNQFHAHEIDWADTAKPNGFKHLPRNLQEFPAFQFKVLKEKRFLGFFNSKNVFEVVWLDFDHCVYPGKKR